MLLQRLIGNIFSVLIEISLWIVLIGSIILGGILSKHIGVDFVNGLYIGLIVGLIIDLIVLSPLVILLDIRNSLKKIEKK